jgi:hypothetical protein
MQEDGQVIRAVNVDSVPLGAKNKRPGYVSFGNNPDGSQVVNLFTWWQDQGTAPVIYRNSGSLLYYDTTGTGNWTICGNGTLTAGSHIGFSVLNNQLLISQNGGTTRTTSDGINFTDASLAPAGEAVEQFLNRIYITGTSNVLYYSTAGDPTNWQTSGTSDSSSFVVPGGGRNNRIFKLNNHLMISKQTRSMFEWDGYNLIDMASNMGLSSPYSYGSVEDNGFWLNDKGVFNSAGDQPTLISNPLWRFIYNTTGSAISGTALANSPGVVHYYDYLLAVGSMTEDLTNVTVPNAIIKYNFQKNEFLNWSFADFPTALHSYRDSTNTTQLIFGNGAGQVFQLSGTATSDNGVPIDSAVEMVFNFNQPHIKKDWRVFYGFFNPGCEGQVMGAMADTFTKQDKIWFDMGDIKDGVVEYRFQNPNPQSRLLFIKIVENSTNAPFTFYGCAIDAQLVPTQ